MDITGHSIDDYLKDIAQAAANPKATEASVSAGQYINLHPDFKNATVTYTPGKDSKGVITNYGRGKFLVAAAHSVGGRGAQMMVDLSNMHFRHLKGALSDDFKELYGVTNYSIYVDKRALIAPKGAAGVYMPDGGMGVLLNGSAVEEGVMIDSNGETAKRQKKISPPGICSSGTPAREG